MHRAPTLPTQGKNKLKFPVPAPNSLSQAGHHLLISNPCAEFATGAGESNMESPDDRFMNDEEYASQEAPRLW